MMLYIHQTFGLASSQYPQGRAFRFTRDAPDNISSLNQSWLKMLQHLYPLQVHKALWVPCLVWFSIYADSFQNRLMLWHLSSG